ncbi:hypothetical protein [Burkholderia diffusa]|uniref:hypothetical protein n=1 Tax=Burkholderia diffusa TaxID=488732 RepID=UPI00158E1C87|nr:hypothetical protein [Burkholderia diffusa]
MRDFSGIFHQASPTQTRVLSNDKLLEFLQIQDFGQVLAHQYCIRRFALHHPKQFRDLRTLRLNIEKLLAETPLNNEDRPFIGKKVTAIARCMRMLDSRRARDLARVGEISKFREMMKWEIEPNPNEITFPILDFISEEQIEELAHVLVGGCEIVGEIQSELNFLDYFDPFALSSLVSGKTLVTHYLAAKNGVYNVHPWATVVTRENYWHLTEEAQLDEEMCNIACEHAFVPKRPPSNVKIFGHNQHHIVVNGIELNNHLILAVPTDRTPTQIDAAWREFRAILREAFIDTVGCYANVSSPEFDNSLFMRNFDGRTFLISETAQYQSRLYGLWMWDLTHPDENRNRLTISKALDMLMPEAEKLLKKFVPNEQPYDSSSHKNQYDDAVGQIAPKPKKNVRSKARDLDYYLTVGQAILGPRDSTETPLVG